MARPKKDSEAPEAPEAPTVVLPADSAVSVYKDRAGKALGGGISEGKANFAAITDAARALVNPKPAA